MKSILGLFIILVFIACSEENSFDQRFMDAYTEILLAREMISDSTEANREVEKILTNYGYTEPEFRAEYMSKMKEPEKFMKTIDSVRRLVKSDLDSIQLREMKERMRSKTEKQSED